MTDPSGSTRPAPRGRNNSGPMLTARRRPGRDGMLAAIMLTSQVLPSLQAPELLLLAAEEVTRRWLRYLEQWDTAMPPADPPVRLVEFVDQYCVQVEHGPGPDGCAGWCTASRTGRGCDPEACAAGAWRAHVTALAWRAGQGHPARAVLDQHASDERSRRR